MDAEPKAPLSPFMALLYPQQGYSRAKSVDPSLLCRYAKSVAGSPGRPQKKVTRDDYLELRLGVLEKQAFRDAAKLAGLPLSTWVRERLRRAAIRELEEVAHPIAFLKGVLD